MHEMNLETGSGLQEVREYIAAENDETTLSSLV